MPVTLSSSADASEKGRVLTFLSRDIRSQYVRAMALQRKKTRQAEIDVEITVVPKSV
jgi:hypothetical protein